MLNKLIGSLVAVVITVQLMGRFWSTVLGILLLAGAIGLVFFAWFLAATLMAL